MLPGIAMFWTKIGDIRSLMILRDTAPFPTAAPHRPLLSRLGRRVRALFDRMIATSSLVANDPVLDCRAFPWTRALRDQWQAIRREAMAVALHGDEPAAPWRSVMLWGDAGAQEDMLARCPATAALVAAVPDLTSAFFSILAPGTHIAGRRGATKGLLTCQLGLIVPRDGDVRMRVHDRIVRWAEGETLVFDDTYDHEVWNDSSGTRVVLMLQIGRPLRAPGRWVAELVPGIVRRSAFAHPAPSRIAA